MNKSNPIIGITLEGFQVFDKPTYIPLDRLTLLFGPNSAGKSAVQDALDLYSKLKEIQVIDSFGAVNNDLRGLLKRHWRKTGNDNKRAKRMSISVLHVTACLVDHAVASELDRTVKDDASRFTLPLKLESRWSFALLPHDGEIEGENDDGEELLRFHNEFEFFIESKLLVSYKQAELQINLNNPFFQNIQVKVDFIQIANAYPIETSLVDGYFTIHAAVINFQACGLGIDERQERWLNYYPIGNGNPDQSLLRAAVAEISLLVGTFLRVSNENSEFKPDVVEASRVVPTSKQLSFRLGNMDDTWDEILATPATVFRSYLLWDKVNLGDSLRHTIHQGDSKYMALAESLTNEFIYETKNSNSEYASKVNQSLTDHLFLERGYRIDFDMRAVLSKADFQAAREGIKLDTNGCGYLVELFLRDGQGRKHLFDDVGSGIGYVLPVLCSVFNPQFSTCFIQQPELHIHPALQAAMGDVFIEASNADKQILIETHSEHLLLRILKRIRQTHLQAAIALELKINANDVCVLYFDPSPDGTTTVKRLRITEDGEFMDRWPRGFFGERDQELLDE